MSGVDLSRPLVVGFGVTGSAVAAALVARGFVPLVVDDRPNDAARERAADLGIELGSVASETGPSEDPGRAWQALVETCSVVLPSPGIPAHHPVFAAAAAAEVPVASEFDLAAMWDDRPLVGITGTNGKTTVTLLVADALERSGVRAAAVGNTEVPLVQAIDDPEIATFVVEASSFRLAHSRRFQPPVAAWLNFAPDHLDAHPSLAAYEEAKASIWSTEPDDGQVVVANLDDEVVMRHVPPGASVVTFGLARGDWHCAQGQLVGPDGPVVAIDDLPRRQPHDLANALAVAAIATAAGATRDGIAEALRHFVGLPHRLELVGEADGVRWFNDSKATVPHATLTDIGGFDSVVLIAGGRNKGLDLSSLAGAVPPVRAVVATGEAAEEIAAVFATLPSDAAVEVWRASSMEAAVEAAAALSRTGDAVVLSPACTSFDWYPNYTARGDDFVRLVRARLSLPEVPR